MQKLQVFLCQRNFEAPFWSPGALSCSRAALHQQKQTLHHQTLI